MGSSDARLIDITCDIISETDKGIQIWDGTMEVVDTAGMKTRQRKYVWLPKSQVEINGDGTITMPEWLAQDKGLI